jgi:hypothetical protein
MNVLHQQSEDPQRESIVSFSSFISIEDPSLNFGSIINDNNTDNANFEEESSIPKSISMVSTEARSTSSCSKSLPDDKNQYLMKQIRRKSKELKRIATNFWKNDNSNIKKHKNDFTNNGCSVSNRRESVESLCGGREFHPVDCPVKQSNSKWVYTGGRKTSMSGPLVPSKDLLTIEKNLFQSASIVTSTTNTNITSNKGNHVDRSRDNSSTIEELSPLERLLQSTIDVDITDKSQSNSCNSKNLLQQYGSAKSSNSHHYSNTNAQTPARFDNSTTAKKRQQPPSLSSSVEEQPKNYDIICGRNSGAYNSVGNRRFRVIIEMNLQRYIDSPTREDKTNVIRSIVWMLQEDIGARFLKKSIVKQPNGTKVTKYTVMTEKQAREKVGHSLRDLVITSRKEQEQKHQQ